MRDFCEGCRLGFHDPSVHIVRPLNKYESIMGTLARAYGDVDSVIEAYCCGILSRHETRWLLHYIESVDGK